MDNLSVIQMIDSLCGIDFNILAQIQKYLKNPTAKVSRTNISLTIFYIFLSQPVIMSQTLNIATVNAWQWKLIALQLFYLH